ALALTALALTALTVTALAARVRRREDAAVHAGGRTAPRRGAGRCRGRVGRGRWGCRDGSRRCGAACARTGEGALVHIGAVLERRAEDGHARLRQPGSDGRAAH